MIPYSWLIHYTHGMITCRYIYRPCGTLLTSLVRSRDIFGNMLKITSLLKTHCTIMLGIVFYISTSLMKKWKKSSISAIEEPLVVIYPNWKQPKNIYVPSTFGHQYSNTVLKQSISAIHASYTQRKCACTQLPCTKLLPWPPLQSGGLILWHAI